MANTPQINKSKVKNAKHPVDQVPPAGKLAVLSIQHVLAFYAGAVIVPLVISAGLKLSPEDTIHLINADLFTCGIATIIQSVGFWKVGVRLPIIQGVTFTAVTPIIAIGLATGGVGRAGLPYIYGSIIISGLFTLLAAPYFAKLIRFFPPVVTGTVLTIMGTTLLSVSAGDFTNYAEGAPGLRDLSYAFGTLALIVLVQRFFRGFMSTIAVLIGLVAGTGIAFLLGDANLDKVASSSWIGLTTPFYYGIPAFSLTGAISMIIVMAITMVETTGDVFAAGEIVGKRITKEHIASSLRADGISTMLGGILNSFPYTCFAQNVGLVRLTRVKSRWVVAGAGGIMIVLGMIPKAGAIIASIPAPVLGGASLAMFANVALVGIQTLSRVDLRDNRNAVTVTTAIGLALIVSFKPGLSAAFPEWARIFFASGITIGSLTAIIINFVFHHIGPKEKTNVSAGQTGSLTLDDVNKLSKEEFVDTFRSVFNSQTWPLERAWESAPFSSVEDLRAAIQNSLLTASGEERLALLRDYPDMATLVSADEEEAQEISKDAGSLALGGASAGQVEKLQEFASEYREKFHIPYVAYLNRTDSVDQILETAARRISNTEAQEHRVAITQIVEIANDRFDMILANANPVRGAWVRRFEQFD